MASANPRRRAPQQARATLRRAKLLEVAARLIGESGYDSLTMTAIAEQAGASIGTLYEYFPDKQTIGLALLAQYTDEMDAHWKAALGDERGVSRSALADVFVDGALKLVQERPAYMALLGASVPFRRSRALRRPLRMTIVMALQALQPELAEDLGFIHAEVIVQLLKSLLSVYREAAPKECDQVAAEFRKVMRLYVAETLR